MRNHFYALLLIFLCTNAQAAEKMSVDEWLELFIDSCVGSGSSFVVSGSVDAGLGLSLKKFKADGTLAGQVEVTKSTYRLLNEGISNAMSEVAADQADKVRECLAPVRRNLLQAMNQQMGITNPLTAPIYILSPYEERVLKVLATHQGEDGQTGKNVSKHVVLREAELSDIRFHSTIRMLQSKVLASETSFPKLVGSGLDSKLEMIDVVSLWDAGEEYVLEMGYAK